MIGRTIRRQIFVGLAALALLSGCDGWGDSAADDVTEVPVIDEPAAAPATVRPPAQRNASAPALPASSVTGPARTIVKTVQQVLRQNTPQGPLDSKSLLELTVAIDPVDSSATGTRQYRLRCLRVRLSQELPGQPPLTFDSDFPATVVPPVGAYRNLAGDGFGFGMSPDGRIAEVTGLEPFLDRCLQGIPAGNRAAVRASLAIAAPQDGLTWLLDESVGLVPPEGAAAGYQWNAGRHISSPSEMVVNTRYTLKQLTAETADVDVAGLISPVGSAPFSTAPGARIVVRGGQLQGECRVDRRTGLPVRSRIEQSLQMTAHLDNVEIEQSRTTTTTLAPLEAPAVIQASHQAAAGATRR